MKVRVSETSATRELCSGIEMTTTTTRVRRDENLQTKNIRSVTCMLVVLGKLNNI